LAGAIGSRARYWPGKGIGHLKICATGIGGRQASRRPQTRNFD